MKPKATDFVVYEVSDIEKAIEFYRDTVGLKLEMRNGECDDCIWAEFSAPPTTLALYAPGNMENRPPSIGGSSIVLAVDDVEESVNELKAKGVAIGFGPFESPVCYMAFFKDPDGNSIGLHKRKDGTFG